MDQYASEPTQPRTRRDSPEAGGGGDYIYKIAFKNVFELTDQTNRHGFSIFSFLSYHEAGIRPSYTSFQAGFLFLPTLFIFFVGSEQPGVGWICVGTDRPCPIDSIQPDNL
jgi:hypothetical protein